MFWDNQTPKIMNFLFFIYNGQTVPTNIYLNCRQSKAIFIPFPSVSPSTKPRENAGIKTMTVCIRKSSSPWMKDDRDRRKLTQLLPPPRPNWPASAPFQRHQLQRLRRHSRGFGAILFGSASRTLHRLCRGLVRLHFWTLRRRRHGERNENLGQPGSSTEL